MAEVWFSLGSLRAGSRTICDGFGSGICWRGFCPQKCGDEESGFMGSNNLKAFGIGQKASVFKANSLDWSHSQLPPRCLGLRAQRRNRNEEDSYLLNYRINISNGKSGDWYWYHYKFLNFARRCEYLKCFSLRERHPPPACDGQRIIVNILMRGFSYLSVGSNVKI